MITSLGPRQVRARRGSAVGLAGLMRAGAPQRYRIRTDRRPPAIPIANPGRDGAAGGLNRRLLGWCTPAPARIPCARDVRGTPPATALQSSYTATASATRSFQRGAKFEALKAVGAIVGMMGGFYLGGKLGAAIEGDGCRCDDPGLRGFLIGAGAKPSASDPGYLRVASRCHAPHADVHDAWWIWFRPASTFTIARRHETQAGRVTARPSETPADPPVPVA